MNAVTYTPRGAALADRIRMKSVVDANGCWAWQGAKTPDGYGNIKTPPGRTSRAHRIAYEELVGPIPEGMHLDHLCRNRACVNPAHLEPVTLQENTRRSPLPIASQNAAKTHCPQGHPYDEANTIVLRRGWRRCRTCKRAEGRPAA